MKKIVFIYTSVLLSICFVYAQKNTGLSFLKIDVDARAAAMAGAYTAVANDAAASYWNPAGLALAQNTTIIGMYNNWFADIAHSFLAVQLSTGKNATALSFNYQNIPGIEIRDYNTEQPAGVVNAFNLCAAFSYATTADDWNIGGSLKYIFEKYFLVSASGVALDLGVLKENIFESASFGMTIQNMGKMSKLDQKASKLPLIVSTGLSYKIPGFFDDNVTLEPDLQWIENEKIYFKLGLQYFLSEYFVLRSGLRNGNAELLWTGGFSIIYNTFHLDYAYAPLEYDLGTSNRFSIGISF